MEPKGIQFRKAKERDKVALCAFCDFWLRNGGTKDKIPGASNDYFIPHGRMEAYLQKYKVNLALCAGSIVGFSVVTSENVLIHLLVAGTFRGRGIGKSLLKRARPSQIRSKTDQSTGNPASFYRKSGYVRVHKKKTGPNRNIQLFKSSAL